MLVPVVPLCSPVPVPPVSPPPVVPGPVTLTPSVVLLPVPPVAEPPLSPLLSPLSIMATVPAGGTNPSLVFVPVVVSVPVPVATASNLYFESLLSGIPLPSSSF